MLACAFYPRRERLNVAIEFLELYEATAVSRGTRSSQNESLTPQFADLTLIRRSAWPPVPLDRPSNREDALIALRDARQYQ